MLTFRRDRVELVLPPTRALVRARRALAGIPGGGGTPLALAVREAMALGQDILRRGRQPLLVFLTDGRGNITLAGEGDRRQAEQDTEQAARALGASGLATLVLDTGRRPEPRARALAEALGAAYAPCREAAGRESRAWCARPRAAREALNRGHATDPRPGATMELPSAL